MKTTYGILAFAIAVIMIASTASAGWYTPSYCKNYDYVNKNCQIEHQIENYGGTFSELETSLAIQCYSVNTQPNHGNVQFVSEPYLKYGFISTGKQLFSCRYNVVQYWGRTYYKTFYNVLYDETTEQADVKARCQRCNIDKYGSWFPLLT